MIEFLKDEKNSLLREFSLKKKDLDNAKKRIGDQIADIKKKLDYNDVLISKIVGESDQTPLLMSVGGYTNLGLTEAVEKLFSDTPQGRYSLLEIKNLLEENGYAYNGTRFYESLSTTCVRMSANNDSFLWGDKVQGKKYYSKRRMNKKKD